MAPGWWARTALRTRLTAAATVVSAFVITGSAVLLLWRVQTSLTADLDLTTVRQALAVAAETAKSGHAIVPAGVSGSAAIQIVDRSGRVVASSANIDGEPRLFYFAAGASSTAPSVRTVTAVPIGDGGNYRVAIVGAPVSGGSYLVYVAMPTSPTVRTVATIGGALLVGVPLLVGLLGAATWLLVGRALHPVEDLRRQAADITAGALDRRLVIPPTDDELARLAITINDMLSRIQGSVGRQRQFVADAAHELRSPVASILAQLEVAERNPASSAKHPIRDSSAGDLSEEARRLSDLVDDLLALARLDATPTMRTETVDLDDLVLSEVAALRLRTAMPIDLSEVSAAQILADRSMLVRVVRNLLDNAARHAAGGIRVSVTATRGKARLVVSDDGVGIPTVDRERVFERFARLDDGRGRSDGGVGLGLAIVKEVIAAHGGSVVVEDNCPGARFTVLLPLAVGIAGGK